MGAWAEALLVAASGAAACGLSALAWLVAQAEDVGTDSPPRARADRAGVSSTPPAQPEARLQRVRDGRSRVSGRHARPSRLSEWPWP